MFSLPPAQMVCLKSAARHYHVPAADILRSIKINAQNPKRFSIGITGIPIAYMSVLEMYGFEQWQMEHDDCTNIRAGALAISFALNSQAVQHVMMHWQNGTISGTISQRAKEWSNLIEAASVKHHVPVALIEAVITQESGFRPAIVSPKGAIGLMQLMPDTAARLNVDPWIPSQNIMGGTLLLHQLLTQYNGNLDLALAAYNAGSKNVARYGGVPPFPETQAYVPDVESLYRHYQSKR